MEEGFPVAVGRRIDGSEEGTERGVDPFGIIGLDGLGLADIEPEEVLGMLMGKFIVLEGCNAPILPLVLAEVEGALVVLDGSGCGTGVITGLDGAETGDICRCTVPKR